MADQKTSERVAEEQLRRRAFLEEVPPCYCPNCTAVLYEAEEVCFNCGFERPQGGWLPIGLSGDPWLGQVLAERYLITRQVAASARARVYIADSRIIPRSFAVKIMNVSGGPNLDEEGLRRRLQREVEALGTLRNPHIVSFYDVFDTGDDHVAFVMDLIDGVTLTQLMSNGALPLPRAISLTRQLANGIFEAHQRGLVHRDLKPSNVMVEKLPIGDDFVRILDFGVMWVRGTAGHGTGALDEMPVFTSPEQIADEAVDQRSDLYSLGALMFYMLTGEPPFDATDFSNPEMLLIEPPPTLEDVTGREFPAQVEALVSKLLSKEPSRRPSDVGRVLEWLDAISAEMSQVSEVSEARSDDEDDEWESPPSDATAFGMVPTLGEASSPVLRLEPSEMSAVSEAVVDGEVIDLMACRGEGYGFVRGARVHWAGSFSGTPPADLEPDIAYVSLALSATRAILGTSDGRIVLAAPGEHAVTAFQDPRLAAITAVAIEGDGGGMVAGSASGRLYMNRGTDFVRMGSGEEAISSICLNERGDQFAVARGSTIQILSVSASNLSTFPSPLQDSVISMAFSPDDYLVAVLTINGTVVLESVHTGQEFMRLDTGNPELRAVTFSSDNHMMGLFREGDRVVLRALT